MPRRRFLDDVSSARSATQLTLPGLASPARTILHVDVDQFVVAVALLRRPDLRGRPVVVGTAGDPTRRGVVSSASYEARSFGVDTGMALRKAARRCPDAVFLPLDLPACRAAARDVASALRSLPAAVEIAGWDEAFVEPATGDPHAFATAVRQRLLEATGLTCSVGIGENKLQAKVASRLAKPGGIVALDSRSWPERIGRLKPEVLVGIGPGRQRRLRTLGIGTVRDLAAADVDALAATFGPVAGPSLRRLARGEDDTPLVRRHARARSHGREHTFETDTADAAAVREAVVRLARAVARDLRRTRRSAVRLTVTVRLAPFATHSHSVDLARPSSDTPAVEEAALRALARFELDRPVRLVGVRAALGPPRTRPRRRRREPAGEPLPGLVG